MMLVHDESAGDNYQEMATYEAYLQIITAHVKLENRLNNCKLLILGNYF